MREGLLQKIIPQHLMADMRGVLHKRLPYSRHHDSDEEEARPFHDLLVHRHEGVR